MGFFGFRERIVVVYVMFHKLKVGIKSVENTFSKHEASKDARFESAYQRFCELEDKASLLSNALRVRRLSLWTVQENE